MDVLFDFLLPISCIFSVLSSCLIPSHEIPAWLRTRHFYLIALAVSLLVHFLLLPLIAHALNVLFSFYAADNDDNKHDLAVSLLVLSLCPSSSTLATLVSVCAPVRPSVRLSVHSVMCDGLMLVGWFVYIFVNVRCTGLTATWV